MLLLRLLITAAIITAMIPTASALTVTNTNFTNTNANITASIRSTAAGFDNVTVTSTTTLHDQTEDDTEDTWNSTGTCTADPDEKNAVDEDWTTFFKRTNTAPECQGDTYINVNYTKPDGITAANWTIKYYGADSDAAWKFECKNTTSWHTVDNFSSSPAITNATYELPSPCVNDNTQLRVLLDYQGSGSTWTLFEEKVVWLNTSPNNYIDMRGYNGSVDVYDVTNHDFNITNGTATDLFFNEPNTTYFFIPERINYTEGKATANIYDNADSALIDDEFPLNITSESNETKNVLCKSRHDIEENITLTVDVTTCDITKAVWNSTSNTYTKQYSGSEYTCSNAKLNIQVPGIRCSETGKQNTLTLNFYHYLNVSVRDEQTDEALTENVSLQFVASNYSKNFTTDNGSLWTNELQSDTYEIRFSADGYQRRFHYFDVEENVNVTHVTLYLLNESLGTKITTYVYDTNGNEIDGAYVKAKRWYKTDETGGSWKRVDMTRTDFGGTGQLFLIKYTEPYLFEVEYEGNTYLNTTSSSLIIASTNEKYFRINLAGSDWYDQYNTYKGVYYNLTFDNTTKTYEFEWHDPNQEMHYACLRVRQLNVSGWAELYEECTPSYQGSLTHDVGTNSSVVGKRFIANAFLKFDNWHNLAVLEQIFDSNAGKFGLSGVFATLIFALALVGIGITIGPAAGITLLVMGVAVTAMLGFIWLKWTTLLTLVVLSGIVISKMRDTR